VEARFEKATILAPKKNDNDNTIDMTDKNEIPTWVKAYTKDLFAYTISKVPDKESADDIVQNTFLSAVEGYSKFKHQSNPKTWLFAILKNKIADHLRNKYKKAGINNTFDPLEICFDEDGWWKPCHRPDDWNIDEQQLLDNPEFNRVLKSCVDHLPAKWSSAVQLKFFYEENSGEICEQLKISVTNFWQMIHRAKVMLRYCLENNWFKKQDDI